MELDLLTDFLMQDFNPKFLAYDTFQDTTTDIQQNLNIVICSDCFINQQMHERVRSVYKCIEKNVPELFESYGVFVHTLTEEELIDVLDFNIEEGNK